MSLKYVSCSVKLSSLSTIDRSLGGQKLVPGFVQRLTVLGLPRAMN